MSLFQVATYTFAVVGLFSVGYFVFQRILGGSVREDAPVRVKRGSVVIFNESYNWEKDDSDGDNEYHYKGRPNRWRVTVKKQGTTCIDEVVAKVVELHIHRNSRPGIVVLRPNGGVRVKDKKNEFVAQGMELVDATPGARLAKVVLKGTGGPNPSCDIGQNEDYEVTATPISV
jgi:hypothetical protein